ncbi:MAG: hypothetical protein D6719_12810 [Candidatus Dadabacteria bacterium]|nr:MAG: hypothetical protein D6719_12810 [Candidatus Dadabacteria bacterium]
MDKNSQDKKHKTETVNLGLLELLNTSAGKTDGVKRNSVSYDNYIRVSAPVDFTTIDSNGSSVNKAPNNYEILMHAQKWHELSILCEKNISSGKKNEVIEAKLWWILAQLKGQLMPASMLAAPLESVSSEIIKSEFALPEELCQMCGNLLQEVANELAKCGCFDTALTFLKRANQFSVDCTVVARELLRSYQTGANTDISRENGICSELRKLCGSQLLDVDEVNSDGGQDDTEKNRLKTQKSIFDSRRLLILGLSILIIVGLVFWNLSARDIAGIVVIKRSSGDARPVPILPELKRIRSVSNLDALYYGINRAEKRDDAKETEHNVVGHKQVVNTSGPLEPYDFGKIMRGQARSHLDIPLGPRSALAKPNEPPAAYPYEKLDQVTMYTIIRPTKIMARPSVLTVSVGTLYEGDRVMVQAKVGNWLQLRSKRGNLGYIRASDARVLSGQSR